MGSHVFVSYSHADAAYVDGLVAQLQAHGIPFWMDRERLNTGDRWVRTIRDHVDSASAVIVVMTPAAEQSEWVALELERARLRGTPIVPLLLAGEVFFTLGTLQYEDVRGGRPLPAPLLDRVRDLVTRPRPLTPPTTVPPPMVRPDPRRRARLTALIAVGLVPLVLCLVGSVLSNALGWPGVDNPQPSFTSAAASTTPPATSARPSLTASAMLQAFGGRWLTAGTCTSTYSVGALEAVSCQLPRPTGAPGGYSVLVGLDRYANAVDRDAEFQRRFKLPTACLDQVGRNLSPDLGAKVVANLSGTSGPRSGCYLELGSAGSSEERGWRRIYWEDESAPVAGHLMVTWDLGAAGDWAPVRQLWQTHA